VAGSVMRYPVWVFTIGDVMEEGGTYDGKKGGSDEMKVK